MPEENNSLAKELLKADGGVQICEGARSCEAAGGGVQSLPVTDERAVFEHPAFYKIVKKAFYFVLTLTFRAILHFSRLAWIRFVVV